MKQHKRSAVVIERHWWASWAASPNKYDQEIAEEAIKRLPRQRKRKKEETR